MTEITHPLASPDPIPNCPECSLWLPPMTVVCPECHTIVYSQHVKRLAQQAAQQEQEQTWAQARDTWQQMLAWLPAGTQQHQAIQARIEENDARVKAGEQRKATWQKRLGPLAPVLLVLAKLKTFFFLLLKLKFLLSFALFFGVYWSLFGPWFGAGFALQILIHELGHVFAVKRQGLKADLPVFLPGFGAYVRWQGFNISIERRAEIALAGPLFGLFAAAGCMGLYVYTQRPVFAALAHAGAWLNLLNLIPVWMLDGGQAAHALSRLQRGLLLVSSVVFFALTDQKVFLFVAAGMAYRLFTRDVPEEPSTRTMVFYMALLFLLGVLLKVIPLQPRGAF